MFNIKRQSKENKEWKSTKRDKQIDRKGEVCNAQNYSSQVLKYIFIVNRITDKEIHWTKINRRLMIKLNKNVGRGK